MSKKHFYDIREITDMKDMIIQSERLFGSKNAFQIKTGDSYKGIIYTDFKNDIDAFGTALLSLGMKDCNIAVIGENSYKWCVTYLGVVNGTGVIVPLDKELPLDDIENLINTSKSAAIIFSGKLESQIKELAPKLPTVKYFINMDSQENINNFWSFDKLLEKGRGLIAKGEREYIDAKIEPDKMSILLFTSGTTGHAKGVMLSHRNICSNISSICSVVKLYSTDVELSILPIHHTYECTCGFIGMIYNGGTITFCEGLRHISKNMQEIKPTYLVLVPLLFENIYKKVWDQARKEKSVVKIKTALILSKILHKGFGIDIRKKLFRKIHDSLGGNVRLIITGAASIEPKVSKFFEDVGLRILQGYGLTECSPLVTGNQDKRYKHSALGLPIPGIEVKIHNKDKSGLGEIAVKGPNVMLGYYENTDATNKCIKDEWFYTGDLGYVDKDGFYYITGRSKNVIVTKNGKNIFPEEVESYLNKSPFIQETLVWGDYDKTSGETLVSAQIVPDFEAIKEKLKVRQISKDDIFKILNDVVKGVNRNMPLYKRIQKFTIRENEFIKTTSKKIKRYMESMGANEKNLKG